MTRFLLISLTSLLSLSTLAQDFFVTAPYTSPNRSTCGAVNNCGLFTTEDHEYQVIIPNAGSWTFSLCTSAYDTRMFLGTTLCGNDLGTNDDFCGLQSELTATIAAGTYYVTVEGYSGCGNYVLDVFENLPAGPEDLCGGAIPIACGGSASGTTVGYNSDSEVFCGTGDGTGGGLWYSFVGTGDQVTASLCASGFDTRIRIFTGTCAALNCIDGNDDFCGTQSQTDFTSTLGVTYYILVHGFSTAEGAYTLSISCSTPGVPTPEDCAGGLDVCSDATFTGNSSGLGNIDDLNTTNQGCLTSGENQSSWYLFQAQTGGTIAFDIATTVDYDFAIWGPSTTVICPPVGAPLRCSYSGASGNTGLAIGSGDTTEGAGGDAYVDQINASAGDFFLMCIDNFTSDFSSFDLNWSLGGGCTLNCAPLPIQLLEFYGVAEAGTNLLHWSTASEVNNDYFTIERSSDGVHFSPLLFYPGAGSSSQQLDYQVIDEQPLPGVNYYRLKQTDYDGTTVQFNTIAIESKGQHLVGLYPNPSTSEINLVTAIPEQQISQLKIRDPRGQVLLSNEGCFSSKAVINVSELPEGVYIAEIQIGSHTESHRFTKY